eukprot:SAG11_NODE_1228_length_5473_cov_3.015445_3_plen_88_part_00
MHNGIRHTLLHEFGQSWEASGPLGCRFGGARARRGSVVTYADERLMIFASQLYRALMLPRKGSVMLTIGPMRAMLAIFSDSGKMAPA